MSELINILLAETGGKLDPMDQLPLLGLLAFLGIFATIATVLAVYPIPMKWGKAGRQSDVSISQMGKLFIAAAAWFATGLILSIVMDWPLHGVFVCGFMLCFVGVMVSAIRDQLKWKRRQKELGDRTE